MSKGRFLRTGIEEMQQLIMKPRPDDWHQKKCCVVFSRPNKVKTTIDRHLAMVCKTPTDSCLPSQNGTAMNRQTHWKRIVSGAPAPQRVPPRPRMPPRPPPPSVWTQSSDTEGVLPGYGYIDVALPSARLFSLDPYAKDRMRDTDFNSDLLTDTGLSTG
jgi:hypothetical protein